MIDWKTRATSADAAVSCVTSGMRVFVHGAAATPAPLVEALSRRTDLADVTLYHLHTTGPAPFAAPEHEGRFFSISLFAAAPVREAIAGAVDLFGKTLRERADLLAGIAHPDFRAELRHAFTAARRVVLPGFPVA